MNSKETNLVFANNLNRLIERSGKTKKEIAEVIGVAPSTFNEWTKGKKYPRMGKVEMLANYFGVLKSDLIEDKKEKPTVDDGLSEKRKALIDFAMSVPEDQAALILRVMKSIVEADE